MSSRALGERGRREKATSRALSVLSLLSLVPHLTREAESNEFTCKRKGEEEGKEGERVTHDPIDPFVLSFSIFTLQVCEAEERLRSRLLSGFSIAFSLLL